MLWPEYYLCVRYIKMFFIHTQWKLRVYPAPSVHVLAVRCIVSKPVHPADALFFRIFSIHSC